MFFAAAGIPLNSTSLVVLTLVGLLALGRPTFKFFKNRAAKRRDEEEWKEDVDADVYGAKASRRRPNPAPGLMNQQEATANAVTTMAQALEHLADRFERHIDHPPGKAS